MAIFHRSLNRRSVEARRCTTCNRGMALVWAYDWTGRRIRYCRWAEQGMCTNDARFHPDHRPEA
jgi:hypothetical protein